MHQGAGGLRLARVPKKEELNNDDTNFWIFTPAGLRQLLSRSGWQVLDWTTLGSPTGDPLSPDHDARTYCLLRSKYCGPLTMARLGSGWHRLEQGLWRWTAQNFSFSFDSLRPAQPYTLHLGITIPEPIIQQLGPMRLQLRSNGQLIAERLYLQPTTTIEQFPATASPSGSLELHAAFDRSLPPSPSDLRELAAIIYTIRLEE